MDNLLRHWGLQGYDVRPVGAGTNNTAYFVGDEFVLRIHRNAIAPAYEHAVLRALSGLSFAVPVPIAAGHGATAVREESELARPRPDLPLQIIHGDFAVTNVLMVEDRVTAILDFETASPGYRAMDLAVGRYFFGDSGRPTPAGKAFQRGYLTRFPLTAAELEALPELELMREATSLVHWRGRYSEGQITPQNLAARMERLLRVAGRR